MKCRIDVYFKSGITLQDSDLKCCSVLRAQITPDVPTEHQNHLTLKHGVISQKARILKISTVATSNLDFSHN